MNRKQFAYVNMATKSYCVFAFFPSNELHSGFFCVCGVNDHQWRLLNACAAK